MTGASSSLISGATALLTGGGGGGVTSVFGRTGVVTAQTGDYTIAQISGAGTAAAENLSSVIIDNGAGALTIGAGQVTAAMLASGAGGTLNATFNANGGITIQAGTASRAPLQLNSGTNLTSAGAGTFEYDGVSFYETADTTSGRAATCNQQYFRLTSTGGTISTIANYFGTTSNISLVSGATYETDIETYYLKTTSGNVTWTFTNSAAPTSMNIHAEQSPIAGISANPVANTLFGEQYNLTSTAPTILVSSLAANVSHYSRFKIFLINGTGTSLKIQATCSAGTITPGIGSHWKCRRLPANSTGIFAA